MGTTNVSTAAVSPFEKLRLFTQKYKKWLLLALFVVVAIIPLVYDDVYYKNIMVKILMYVIIASSLNMINGYSGQFNLGQAGFLCIGAYTASLLATRLGWNFLVTMPLAGIVTMIFGYLVSKPTLRLSGIYLSIVTLGFSEIVRLVVYNWTDFTGGPLGVKGIPAPEFFGISFKETDAFYYLVLVLVVITLFVMHRVLNSRVGRAWMSIREDQLAASSLGVELRKYKSQNFMFGAFFAGIGGCLFAYFYRYIDANMFLLDEGFNVISMVVIGGQGTLVGPVLGAVIVNTLTEALRSLDQFRMVIYAALIIFMMWWRPQGLAGASNSILAGGKLRRKGKAADEEESDEEGGSIT